MVAVKGRRARTPAGGAVNAGAVASTAATRGGQQPPPKPPPKDVIVVRDEAYDNFKFSTYAFNQAVVPRPVFSELIRLLSEEIKARGVLAPYILLPYRPDADSRESRRLIAKIFPPNLPPLQGEDLMRELRNQDPYCLATVLKWCWARLPGGVVTWPVYRKFRDEEKKENYPLNSFVSIFPKCMETETHARIVFEFFDLLAAIATHARRNGMPGRKLARLAGLWAFDVKKPDAENDPTSFADGLSAWSVAADANNHLFHAFLRSLKVSPPTAPPGSQTKIAYALEQVLASSHEYPPPPINKRRLVPVPMVTLKVGRLSATPMVMLTRAAKVIPVDNLHSLVGEDDYNTLYFLFSDPYSVEEKLNNESARIVEEIIAENPLITDHKLLIKDTPRSSYDVRAKTWSKFYNHAYVDPATGDLKRPLTNYVYDRKMREDIVKVKVPSQMVQGLPYPDTPSLEELSKPNRLTIDWNTFTEYGFDASRITDVTSGGEDVVKAEVMRVSIDDFFVWVWMSSLSQEQTEIRKATFGRSIVVELDIAPHQRRLVVVEEILSPPPKPMVLEEPPEEESLPIPKAAPTRPIESQKIVVKKKREVVKRKPVTPQPLQVPTKYGHHTQKIIMIPPLDPLADALAKRLRRQQSEKMTQTEQEAQVQTDDMTTPTPENPFPISHVVEPNLPTPPPNVDILPPPQPNRMVDTVVQTDDAFESSPPPPSPPPKDDDDSKSVYYTPSFLPIDGDQPITDQPISDGKTVSDVSGTGIGLGINTQEPAGAAGGSASKGLYIDRESVNDKPLPSMPVNHDSQPQINNHQDSLPNPRNQEPHQQPINRDSIYRPSGYRDSFISGAGNRDSLMMPKNDLPFPEDRGAAHYYRQYSGSSIDLPFDQRHISVAFSDLRIEDAATQNKRQTWQYDDPQFGNLRNELNYTPVFRPPPTQQRVSFHEPSDMPPKRWSGHEKDFMGFRPTPTILPSGGRHRRVESEHVPGIAAHNKNADTRRFSIEPLSIGGGGMTHKTEGQELSSIAPGWAAHDDSAVVRVAGAPSAQSPDHLDIHQSSPTISSFYTEAEFRKTTKNHNNDPQTSRQQGDGAQLKSLARDAKRKSQTREMSSSSQAGAETVDTPPKVSDPQTEKRTFSVKRKPVGSIAGVGTPDEESRRASDPSGPATPSKFLNSKAEEQSYNPYQPSQRDNNLGETRDGGASAYNRHQPSADAHHRSTDQDWGRAEQRDLERDIKSLVSDSSSEPTLRRARSRTLDDQLYVPRIRPDDQFGPELRRPDPPPSRIGGGPGFQVDDRGRRSFSYNSPRFGSPMDGHPSGLYDLRRYPPDPYLDRSGLAPPRYEPYAGGPGGSVGYYRDFSPQGYHPRLPRRAPMHPPPGRRMRAVSAGMTGFPAARGGLDEYGMAPPAKLRFGPPKRPKVDEWGVAMPRQHGPHHSGGRQTPPAGAYRGPHPIPYGHGPRPRSRPSTPSGARAPRPMTPAGMRDSLPRALSPGGMMHAGPTMPRPASPLGVNDPGLGASSPSPGRYHSKRPMSPAGVGRSGARSPLVQETANMARANKGEMRRALDYYDSASFSNDIAPEDSTSALPLPPLAKKPPMSAGCSGMSIGNASLSTTASKWSEVKMNLEAMRQDAPPTIPVLPEQSTIESYKMKSAQSVLGGSTAPEDYYTASINSIRRPSVSTGPHVKAIAMGSDPELGHKSSGSTPDPSTGIDNSMIIAARKRYSGGGNTHSEMAKAYKPSGAVPPPPGPQTLDPRNEKSVERALRAGLFDGILGEQPPPSFMDANTPRGQTKKRRSLLDVLPSPPAALPLSGSSDQAQVSRYSIVGLINAAKKKRESN